MRTFKLFLLASIIVGFGLLTACGGGEKKPEKEPTTEQEPKQEAEPKVTEKAPEETPAICIYKKGAGLYSDEDNKWLTSITPGEKVMYQGITEERTIGGKARNYLKVKLSDGTIGWSQEKLVVPAEKPGVVINEAKLYKRPDLLTGSDESFSAMDIVAVVSEQGDFLQIAGQRTGDSWIDEGYVKPENVSFEQVDIAVATYYSKAMAKEDDMEKLKALAEILNNSDLSGSSLISIVDQKAMSLQ